MTKYLNSQETGKVSKMSKDIHVTCYLLYVAYESEIL